jgi:hypothetical protein
MERPHVRSPPRNWGDGKTGERRAVCAQDNALAVLAALEKKLAA